jgi:hypothetical protein
VGDDLLVAAVGVGPDGAEFEAVEGALAGQGLAAVGRVEAVIAEGVALADEDGEQGVAPEAVMVVEILVAQAEAEDALLEEFEQGVLDALGITIVGEAAGEGLKEVEVVIDLAQEEAAGVGGDGAAVEGGDDLTGSQVLEIE